MGLRLSKQQAAEMLARYDSSGKTLSGFCKSENIKPHVHYYWRDKLNKTIALRRGKFIKLARPLAEAGLNKHCKIQFSNGTRLILGQP